MRKASQLGPKASEAMNTGSDDPQTALCVAQAETNSTVQCVCTMACAKQWSEYRVCRRERAYRAIPADATGTQPRNEQQIEQERSNADASQQGN